MSKAAQAQPPPLAGTFDTAEHDSIHGREGQSHGFIKLIRSSFLDDIIRRHRLAFLLLTVIALRARRRQAAACDLQLGEAMIGDHNAYGMTRAEYRAALKRLVRLGLIVIVAASADGTIVRLISASVFDINAVFENTTVKRPRTRPSESPATNRSERPPVEPDDNLQTTTNKNVISKNHHDDEASRESSADYWPQRYSEKTEADRNPRWKIFAKYCETKGGQPCLKGFNTWLQKQPLLKRQQIQRGSNGSAKYEAALIASMRRGDIENEVTNASSATHWQQIVRSARALTACTSGAVPAKLDAIKVPLSPPRLMSKNAVLNTGGGKVHV